MTQTLLSDLRYGTRLLRQSPVFGAIAVLRTGHRVVGAIRRERAADPLLDDDLRALLLNDLRIDVVLPEIDCATELLGQERHQCRAERIHEHHSARSVVRRLGDDARVRQPAVGIPRLEDAGDGIPGDQHEVLLAKHLSETQHPSEIETR